MKYTKISIKSEASNFTNDLWINPSAPYTMSIKSLIYSNIDIFFITLFLILSIASSLIAALIIFSDYKPYYKGFMVLGLMNSLSILGLIIVSFISIDKLLSIKIPENKTYEKFSEILSTSLSWAFTISIILLAFFSPIIYLRDYIIFFSVIFAISYAYFFFYKTLYWIDFKIASYITAFSISFIILSTFSYLALGMLLNDHSYISRF